VPPFHPVDSLSLQLYLRDSIYFSDKPSQRLADLRQMFEHRDS